MYNILYNIYNSMHLHDCTKHLNGRSANQLWCISTAGS